MMWLWVILGLYGLIGFILAVKFFVSYDECTLRRWVRRLHRFFGFFVVACGWLPLLIWALIPLGMVRWFKVKKDDYGRS